MTRLVARLGELLAPAPGRPSLVDTASLAMFSLVGAPPLAWLQPTAGSQWREAAADRDAGERKVSATVSVDQRGIPALTFEAAPEGAASMLSR